MPLRTKKTPMPDRLSILVRTLYQIGGVPISEMMDKRKYPNLSKYSRTTLFRHAKRQLDEIVVDRRHKSKGRPRLKNDRDLRQIRRQVGIPQQHLGTL